MENCNENLTDSCTFILGQEFKALLSAILLYLRGTFKIVQIPKYKSQIVINDDTQYFMLLLWQSLAACYCFCIIYAS